MKNKFYYFNASPELKATAENVLLSNKASLPGKSFSFISTNDFESL